MQQSMDFWSGKEMCWSVWQSIEKIPVSNEVFLITEEYLKQGCTLIYLATDGELAGYLALADTIREESTAMIDALKALQVDPVLLTGIMKMQHRRLPDNFILRKYMRSVCRKTN